MQLLKTLVEDANLEQLREQLVGRVIAAVEYYEDLSAIHQGLQFTLDDGKLVCLSGTLMEEVSVDIYAAETIEVNK